MPRSGSKERKMPRVLSIKDSKSLTPLTTAKPKERHRHSRKVECAAFFTLLLSIVAIFVRLRKNRMLLPHELRVNPIIVSSENPHFHIVHVVIDDLGWSDVSWRQEEGIYQMQTPMMNQLKEEGVLLNQFYTPKDCAPSRASMMTGRWPFRVGYYGNPGDDGGVPETFEFLPQMLYRRYGFLCHHIGKWHLGFRKDVWTPTERGFLTSLGFYHWGEDYEAHRFPPEYAVGRDQGCRGYDMVNATSGLFHRMHPGLAVPKTAKKLASGGFLLPVGENVANVPSAQLYAREIEMRIAQHPIDKPLYLNIAPQHVHDPYGDGTEKTMSQRRHMYEVLVHEVDEMMSHLVSSLRNHELWNHTLLLIHTDNGGELLFEETCSAVQGRGEVDVGIGFRGGAANNGPLRGGKFTLWQGGIRGIGLLSGGALPAASRGTSFEGLVHVVDVWASFAFLAHALGHLTHHRHLNERGMDQNDTFHIATTHNHVSGIDSVASLAAAIFSPDFDSRHSLDQQGQVNDISTDLMEWMGLDNAFQGDTHLAAIMSVPLSRAEIVLQPLNIYSNGDCTLSLQKSPFRPSCASGLIRWPYKLLIGFPGDSRHVNWIENNRTTPGSRDPKCEVRTPNKDGLLDGFGLGVCTVESPCLFNLDKDPLELDNLLNGHQDEHIMMQANGVPTTHFETVYRSMYQRLVELSKNGPPPVSASGDDDRFPPEACAQVTETGTWLPWEYQARNA